MLSYIFEFFRALGLQKISEPTLPKEPIMHAQRRHTRISSHAYELTKSQVFHEKVLCEYFYKIVILINRIHSC